MSKLRWRIAETLNRLPGQCWANLVDYALGSRFRRSPWQPIDDMCRSDAAANGSCYCGKLGQIRISDCCGAGVSAVSAGGWSCRACGHGCQLEEVAA